MQPTGWTEWPTGAVVGALGSLWPEVVQRAQA